MDTIASTRFVISTSSLWNIPNTPVQVPFGFLSPLAFSSVGKWYSVLHKQKLNSLKQIIWSGFPSNGQQQYKTILSEILSKRKVPLRYTRKYFWGCILVNAKPKRICYRSHMLGCVNIFLQGVRKVVVHIICLFIISQFYGCLTWSSFPLPANATLRQYIRMVFSARTFQHQCPAEKKYERCYHKSSADWNTKLFLLGRRMRNDLK